MVIIRVFQLTKLVAYKEAVDSYSKLFVFVVSLWDSETVVIVEQVEQVVHFYNKFKIIGYVLSGC